MSSEVSAVSVPQGVAEHLRGLIRRGELSPGDQLPPERQLAETLGVARVSLREALKLLQDEGYLTVRRGKLGGTFVTALSQPLAEWRREMAAEDGELDDLTAVRVALESHAALLAASRRTQDDLDAMEASIELQATARNRSEFRAADATFHDAIARAAGSRRLEAAIRQARSEFFSPADMVNHPDPVEEDQEQHRAIFEAIRDSNAPRAAQSMRDHIENTRSEIRRLLKQGD
ncbi:FadR/GntR family transcriptional regulator [Arthrobacter sp. K5]|uniref:FadR/GntR family transcriptional regulator n=1 Tax=Arthrobacter sp. K5 TaxID=2839623 RepID=A0AAU8EX18_9MICC